MNTITEECTGCRMCEKKCPQNAIHMIENREGFLEAKIDTKKCVNCGVCKNKCPQNNSIKCNIKKVGYAVTIKDDEILKNSSSGGMFAILAKNIIKEGGVVYGAAYNKELIVNHIRIDSILEIGKLQNSKYVQSNTLNTYVEVKEDLEKNRKVLYSGTPCQIAGLLRFLNRDYENLLTIDIICHGVPSPKLFKKYIEYLEIKNKHKIEKYNFRTKNKRGWSVGYYDYYYNGNKYAYKSSDLDPYYYNFLKGTIYRECCYKCKYANMNRVGDITIGDYWGIEDNYPKAFNKNGVSCVIINTEKGKKVFNDTKTYLSSLEVPLDDIIKGNHNLVAPTIRPNKRDYIYRDIDNKDIIKYFEKNLKVPTSHKVTYIRRKITAIIPKEIKKKIKRNKNNEK